MTGLFQSKRFWLSIAGVVGVVAAQFGLDLDPETVNMIVLLIASWIVGDSLRPAEPKK